MIPIDRVCLSLKENVRLIYKTVQKQHETPIKWAFQKITSLLFFCTMKQIVLCP